MSVAEKEQLRIGYATIIVRSEKLPAVPAYLACRFT